MGRLRQEALGDGSLQSDVHWRCRLQEIQPGGLEFQLTVVFDVACGYQKMMERLSEFPPQFIRRTRQDDPVGIAGVEVTCGLDFASEQATGADLSKLLVWIPSA